MAWSLRNEFNFAGQRVVYDVLGEGSPIVMAHVSAALRFFE